MDSTPQNRLPRGFGLSVDSLRERLDALGSVSVVATACVSTSNDDHTSPAVCDTGELTVAIRIPSGVTISPDVDVRAEPAGDPLNVPIASSPEVDKPWPFKLPPESKIPLVARGAELLFGPAAAGERRGSSLSEGGEIGVCTHGESAAINSEGV